MVAHAVKYNHKVWNSCLSKRLKNDREVVWRELTREIRLEYPDEDEWMIAVRTVRMPYFPIYFIPQNFLQDRKIVLEFLEHTKDGTFFKILEVFRDDREVVMKAAKLSQKALVGISVRLQNDKEIVKGSVKNFPFTQARK